MQNLNLWREIIDHLTIIAANVTSSHNDRSSLSVKSTYGGSTYFVLGGDIENNYVLLKILWKDYLTTQIM